MNIVFLARRIYPYIGGVETHVLEISRLLVKKGHKVTIITERQEGLLEREGLEGIDIVRLNIGQKDDFFKKFRIWKEFFFKLHLFRKSDVVHCHDVFFWYLPFKFLFINKPVYTTFHGFEGKYPVSKKAIVVRKISEKLSRGNICVGKFIEKWYGTRSNAITYGGVGQFSISNFQFSKKKNEKLKILFIGRLDVDTGIVEYLKVLDELKKKNIKFEFEVVGDGKYKAKAKQFGKVYGFVSDPQINIAKADMIFTSSYLSILEAFIQKKPVISIYANPLKKDYLEMTPFAKWITISNNPKEVAQKIIENKNVNMKEASIWAYKQTWENVVSIYEKLW